MPVGGVSTSLFTFTDKVMEPDQEPIGDVNIQLPLCLQNMLVITIRPERLQRFMARIGPLAPHVSVVDGVNGETLDLPALERAGTVKHFSQLNRLTRGQVGCFLSHRMAWERIANGTAEHGFVMEDDCDFRPSRKNLQLIETALAEIKDIAWDLLYVSRNPAYCKKVQRVSEHVVQVGDTWGLIAYVLTRKAAQELLRETVIINGRAVDTFVSLTKKAAVVKLGISPIPFFVVDEKSDTQGIK